MALIVKKFGGSSVATPEKIMAIAERIATEKKDDKIVVVVSAMGDTTDDLINLAKSTIRNSDVNEKVYRREMDMLLSTGEQVSIALLAMAFNKIGFKAVSMTGLQAGIATNKVYNKAKIQVINPKRVLEELNNGNIVIVAGFQGYNADGDITTLGRGGSDTTAVALAAALRADYCEIYTDVDGIYSTDPRIVSTARRMKEITYSEMLEMARLGAGVMHPRSVELGEHYGIPIHVRSTFTKEPGTFIRGEYTNIMEEKEFVIRGVTHDTNVAKVAVLGVPDKPGIAYKIFSALATANIDVDMIVQSVRNTDEHIIDMMFTVAKSDSGQVRTILKGLDKEIVISDLLIEENVTKVSVVGAGMLGNPGTAANVFGALADAGINIEAISTSEISISCLICEGKEKEAVNAIHARRNNTRMIRSDIRNIAIIAHVDHGKTTLVDAMLKQSGVFRSNEQVAERVMDSNELERERGITILAKNTAIMYQGVKINVVDTPGHADFGGEVERVLNMVDGVLLVVDAFEGPMPQTKYVLRKALAKKLKPIVVINKIDRNDQRSVEVIDEVLELFIELEADDEQLDFPVVYTSARDGVAKLDMDSDSPNLTPLFECLLTAIPCPTGEIDSSLQVMITTLDYDDYVGKIAIGRVVRGQVTSGQNVLIINSEKSIKGKIARLYLYEGLKRVEVKQASLGDIIAIVGLEEVTIGDTIADVENAESLPGISVDEPTLSMTFSVNTSPFAGKEGEYVTSRHVRDRLLKEVQTNVSLKVKETDSPDTFEVAGRGELHLSILIETMRREGYELEVGKPKVIYKEINGQVHEPIEFLSIDVPQEFMGAVMESLGARRAELVNMTELAGYLRLEFTIPARGLIGFRSGFLTDTKGTGIMNHVFHGYSPFKGDVPGRTRGALVAFAAGETTVYGIHSLEDRGVMFISPGQAVYEGMIVGENSRESDMDVNPCKKKHVTNMRASGSDEAVRLTVPRLLTLEQALEYINDDELVEITPQNIRLRKAILDRHTRGRERKNAQ
ncbi:translation elongation factor-related [Holotrichia oblita]|nr:translation elongation factor-related [Holotrichia oblita]